MVTNCEEDSTRKSTMNFIYNIIILYYIICLYYIIVINQIEGNVIFFLMVAIVCNFSMFLLR